MKQLAVLVIVCSFLYACAPLDITEKPGPSIYCECFKDICIQHILNDGEDMRILGIDDKRHFDGAEYIALTYKEGLKQLHDNGPWDILYLDHDLGSKDGHDGMGILNWLEWNLNLVPKHIIVVTSNPPARLRMHAAIKKIYELKEKANGKTSSENERGE